MFNIKAGLFCHRRVRAEHGMVSEGVSHRYTAITLLGLIEAEAAGLRARVDWRVVLKHLLDNLGWVDGVGDLGLLLWLCASAGPAYIKRVCAAVDPATAVKCFSDSRMGKTTELAWLLAGAAHAALACEEYRRDFRGLALQTYEALKRNQRPGGLFGHLAKRLTVRAAVRGHIGCFADQVYPIYAMTRFAAAFEHEEALALAQRCAASICRLQGSEGQWWWHYDSVSSRVFGSYPVFSVHQDGMAPMALFAVSEAGREAFIDPIYKGLQWISGANELDYDMRDYSDLVIWRSIEQERRHRLFLARALGLRSPERASSESLKLNLNFECRPYHFGWLLYAFARRQTPVPAGKTSQGSDLA